MKFCAWMILLPVAINSIISIAYFHGNIQSIDLSFGERMFCSCVKCGVMALLVCCPLWGWYEWGIKTGED